MKPQITMKVIESKTTNRGIVVSILEAGNGKGEFFANGKRYWIAFNNGSPRNAIAKTNSLNYLKKKFDKINVAASPSL